MKKLAIVIISLSTLSASAITLDEIISGEGLIFKDSRGPQYRGALEGHALEKWDEVADLNNLIDDGLNHAAFEQDDCQLDVEHYNILEVDIDYASVFESMAVKFNSIKRSERGRSVAYEVIPVVTYPLVYEYLEKEGDTYESMKKKTINCVVEGGTSFFYKHSRDGSIEYLGYQ